MILQWDMKCGLIHQFAIPSNYILYHTDHCDGYGAVMISIKNPINSQLLCCSTCCEIYSVKLNIPHSPPLIIIDVYRPPNRI